MASDELYMELRNFLINNTHNYKTICIAIGIPEKEIYHKYERYKNNLTIMLPTLFNKWFLIASKITSMWGVTPKLLMAYAYYITFNRSECFSLLGNDNSKYSFIENHLEFFDTLRLFIYLNYCDINSLPYGVAKMLKLR